MEGIPIQGGSPIIPGWRWLDLRVPINQQSAGGAGVSTPCGAISTGESFYSAPRFVEAIEIRRDFRTTDRSLSFPCLARLGVRSPEGQLLPRAPRPLIGQGRARRAARPMGLGLDNAGITAVGFLLLYSSSECGHLIYRLHFQVYQCACIYQGF